MSKTTWSDVEKGDVVDLGGRAWTVTKCKPKKKTVVVRVEFKGRTSDAEVQRKSKVKILTRAADVDPVQDKWGAQRRWAKPAELSAALAPGDAARTKPPRKPAGKKWDDKPDDKIEKRLGKVLGATLVGESANEAEGYHVPPVDVSTVASHLALMHGGIPGSGEYTEGELIAMHTAQHAEAKTRGARLAVNHWHTERRP